MTIEDEFDEYAESFDEADDMPGQADIADDALAALEIDSRVHASKELRKLARVEREAAEVRAVYDARRAADDAFLADRMRGIESKRRWITVGLELFMRAEAQRSRIKSLALPDGVLALTKARTRVEGNPDLIPEDQKPFLVRWKAEIDKPAVSQRLTQGAVIGDEGADGTVRRFALGADGEPVPGVWFVTADAPMFKVTLTEPEEVET